MRAIISEYAVRTGACTGPWDGRMRPSPGWRMRHPVQHRAAPPQWTRLRKPDRTRTEPICSPWTRVLERRGCAARFEVRHPLRADPDRPQDAQEPLLPGAPLHRRGLREARDAGLSPWHEGGGRLG